MSERVGYSFQQAAKSNLDSAISVSVSALWLIPCWKSTDYGFLFVRER